MTPEELEASNALNELPRSFFSRKIINCLEHDDFSSRCSASWEKRNWFRIMTEKEDQGESSLPIPNVAGKAPTLNYAAPTNKNTKARTKETVATPSKTIRTPSSEMIVIETALLHEKGKVDCALRKGMSQKSARVLMNPPPPPPPFRPCSLPDGLWSLAFCLGDKIYFNMDDAERGVIKNMSEQQLANNTMELAC